LQSDFINRRRFFCSISGFAASVVAPMLPFEIKQWSKMPTAEQGFLIVNGWVLTREDISESTHDVV
jgi:hypothetical protein